MPEIKNTFVNGVMNKDLDERLIPQGTYRHAENIDVDTSEGSNVGAAQNVLGNTKVADIATISGQPDTDARTIGAVKYEAKNLIYWFVTADWFDGIYEFNTETNTTTRVLQSNKPSQDGLSKLRFRKEYPITGVNYIIGNDGNDFLYWTDDYNPPRRINITRAKSYDIDDDRIDYDIDVIIEPPLYAPSIYAENNPNEESSNMLERFIFFAYRYKYIDGQYSSLSPFSAVAFGPNDYEFDYGAGNNKSMTNYFNTVKVTVETGNEFVKEIQVVVRDTRSTNVCIIDNYNKEIVGIADNDSYTLSFNNSKIYSALPNDQVTRLFDNVPLLAKAQDVIGNRLAYGNYVQFRDIKNCIGDDIDVSYTLSLRTSEASPTDPKSTWRSDRSYEVGIVYLDDYGRMTTVLTSKENSIYIPPYNSVTANTIQVAITNEPPCWATHYRLVVKQNRGKFYNIFPILFYAQGLYRYFLINDSDVDKFKVGEYVIFKSDTEGATQSNKKYKIIEFEQKQSGFLGGSQLAGLYFKIKVDDQSEFNPSNVFTFNNTGAYGNNYNYSFQNYPVQNRFAVVENPIHYGVGDPNALYLASNSNPSPAEPDKRFTVEIVDQTTFRYTIDVAAAGSWTSGTIVPNTDIVLSSNGSPGCTIRFNSQQYYEPGDKWKINVRSAGHLSGNYFGGVGIPSPGTILTSGGLWGGAAVLPGLSWSPTTGVETDRPIQPGATITIEILSDSLNPSQQYGPQQFTSPSYYENIEEWFIESGAYQSFHQYNTSGNDVGATGVTFRRGTGYGTVSYGSNIYSSYIQQGSSITSDTLKYPVHMIIQGYGYNNNDVNTIKVSFSIQQQETPTICETVPKDADVDIYHETLNTYPIKNGVHVVMWDYDDYEFVGGNTRFTQFDNRRPHYFNIGDEIEVQSGVCNGTATVIDVENQFSIVTDFPFPGAGPADPGKIRMAGSYERDQNGFVSAIVEINKPNSQNSEYNAWTFGNGLESDRIYDDFNETTKEFSPRVTTPVEDYKQVRSESAICYSGIFKQGSGVNRLNEFNLSLANFKYLDRDFGSIQKLYAKDTNLVVFQENKVSNVLYEKNVLFDSVGGGQVASVPEVLGNQIPIDGEYGISKNPESFSEWGHDVFFTDSRRGLVLQMAGDQIMEISSLGMKDYFRDLMKSTQNKQKIGAYDPHNHRYVLSSNDQRNIPCKLDIDRTGYSGPSNAFKFLAFTIITDVEWTLATQNIGSGTSWVTGFPTSGYGSQEIYVSVAQNLTGSSRKINFVVTYCDGLTETFQLSQARGKKGKVVVAVFSNKLDR